MIRLQGWMDVQWSEFLKKGGMAMLEWLMGLLNVSFDMGVVPMDWRGVCIKGRLTSMNEVIREVFVCSVHLVTYMVEC